MTAQTNPIPEGGFPSNPAAMQWTIDTMTNKNQKQVASLCLELDRVARGELAKAKEAGEKCITVYQKKQA